jgi:hypothetical protein
LNIFVSTAYFDFSKTFLPFNLHATHKTNDKNRLKKCWILPKLWQKNNFWPSPWASGAILSQNEKTFSTISPHFQHKQNAKEILRKNPLKQKL